MSNRSSRLIGVFWGRFNPPHRGHLSVIRRLRRRCRLIVAIGSAEHNNEKMNPFSGTERKAMLEAYLKDADIRDVRVVTLNDGRSRAWAVNNMVRTCTPDVVFLSRERADLADLVARKVRVVRFPRTGTISSTRIRDSIAKGDSRWKNLTGATVARMVERADGVRRIQRTYQMRSRTGAKPRRTRIVPG